MPKTKPAYTEEFKKEVLAYLASGTESLKSVAVHFGVTPNSLREWQRRAQARLGAPGPVVATESAEQELRRLRRENRALQMRCEILKKTVVIFSSPSPGATN
jgi:transposase